MKIVKAALSPAVATGNAVQVVKREFQARFGEPRIFRAPGRVNLIGEHTDYNEGFVLPIAIDLATWIGIAPITDGTLRVLSLNFMEEHSFSTTDETAPAKIWTDYVWGVAQMLARSGRTIPAAKLVIWGEVPLGAGLSSSASLEVATAFALLALSKQQMSRTEIALLCQRAENEFVGARCGIMDQFIAANACGGKALMLDCRSLAFELLPIPPGVSIVIANTGVKHAIASGEYNRRRAECEEGVRLLRQALPGIRAFRDVSAGDLERNKALLPEIIYHRCRHVVTENQRVLAFAQALKGGDLARAGELMWASHASLRDDYEVSCRELDVMVEAARAAGAIGSRMTGGGFGGCTVSLVSNDDVERFRDVLPSEYCKATGVRPEIYITRAAEGAAEVFES